MILMIVSAPMVGRVVGGLDVAVDRTDMFECVSEVSLKDLESAVVERGGAPVQNGIFGILEIVTGDVFPVDIVLEVLRWLDGWSEVGLEAGSTLVKGRARDNVIEDSCRR
jgi:hypothetical protein